MKSGYPEDAVVVIVRALKILAVALALGALPLTAAPQQQPTTEDVDKIVAQEQAEMQSLRQYSPIVETYIQILRPNKDLDAVPKGDKYFLGRAELAKGVEIEPLINGSAKHNMFGGLGSLVSMTPNARPTFTRQGRALLTLETATSASTRTLTFRPAMLQSQLPTLKDRSAPSFRLETLIAAFDGGIGPQRGSNLERVTDECTGVPQAPVGVTRFRLTFTTPLHLS
jgi:hypothetical protein